MGEASGPVRRDRLGLWLGAALVVASVLILQAVGTYAFHVDALTRIVCAMTIGALLLAWGLAAVARPSLRPRTVLAGPLVLAMLAFGAAVLGSQRPRLSLEPALIGVASGLTLLMLTSLLRNPTVRRLVGVMILLLPVVISVLYVGAVLVEWVRWWTLVGRLAAPPLRPSFVDLNLGSPNLVATYLILFAPLASAVAARRFSVRWVVPVLGLAGVALLLTGSRSGYVGAAAAALLAAFLGRGAIVDGARGLAIRLGRGRLRLVIAGVAGIGVIGGILVGPGLLARVSLAGADYRSWFWRSASELFAGSPVIGAGPGTWAQLKLASPLPTEINVVVPHAHSLLFQTIAEVGALGAGGLLLVAAAVAWRSRQVHRRADHGTGVEVIAAIAGLAGLVGQQATDYLMNLPAVALGTGLLIAWIDSAETTTVVKVGPVARRSIRFSGPAAIALGAVLLVALPTLVRVAGAMAAAERAGAAAAGGDWTAALVGYDQAVNADPDFTLYRIERGNALAHLGRHDEARDAYAGAIDDDLLPMNLIALAALELETGDPARAAELARMALVRGPNDTMVELNAGRILEMANDQAGAVVAYAAAVRDTPALASSSWWGAADRTVTLEAVVVAARSAALADGDIAIAAIISAYAGRIDEARQDVASIADPASRSFLSSIVEGLGGDRAAGIAGLEARLAAAPNDFQALAWLVQVLRAAGDPAADEYAQRARILRRDEADTAIRVLSVVPATDRSQGAVPGYPFAVYSRKGPLDPWPPQVLVIGAAQPS